MSTHPEARPARLLRRAEGAWRPSGGVAPAVDDDGMHAASLAEGSVVYLHLPAGLAVGGDQLVVRERALRLLGRCASSRRALAALRAHMLANYEPELAEPGCSLREVWSAWVLTAPELAAVTVGCR